MNTTVLETLMLKREQFAPDFGSLTSQTFVKLVVFFLTSDPYLEDLIKPKLFLMAKCADVSV